MPPAAQGHQTLSAYIASRFDEFSRSQKDVAQYVVDHLDEVAFHTAEELARRANTSSLDRRALQPGARLRGLPGAPGGRPRGVPPRHPQARDAARPGRRRAAVRARHERRIESAIAADHVNVEDTARRGQPLRGRGRDRGDRDRRPRADRRHRPDGVLRLLPAPPADAARHPRRDRRLAVAGGAVAAGPDRPRHARHRAVGRPAAPARRAGDQDRPPPQGARRSRSSTRRSRRSPSSPSARCTTRRTRRPSCARTRACCRCCRRSPTASTRATRRSYDERIRAFKLK